MKMLSLLLFGIAVIILALPILVSAEVGCTNSTDGSYGCIDDFDKADSSTMGQSQYTNTTWGETKQTGNCDQQIYSGGGLNGALDSGAGANGCTANLTLAVNLTTTNSSIGGKWNYVRNGGNRFGLINAYDSLDRRITSLIVDTSTNSIKFNNSANPIIVNVGSGSNYSYILRFNFDNQSAIFEIDGKNYIGAFNVIGVKNISMIEFANVSIGATSFTVYANYYYLNYSRTLFTPPTFSISSVNNSNPQINHPVQLGIKAFDDTSLSMVIFSWNLTGTWKNVSNSSVQVNPTVNLNYTVNLTPTQANTVGFMFCANDSTNNKGCSATSTFVVADTTFPTWSDNQTNITPLTRLNYSIQLNLTLIDNFNLSSFIFSSNISGFWLNNTNIFIDNINIITITNKTINESQTKHKGWTIYFNDSFGNRNQSDIFTFNIANIIPNAINISITEIPITAGNTLRGHCLPADADNDVISGNWTHWYINNTLNIDAENTYSLLGGNVTDNANITFSCSVSDSYENSSWVNSSIANVGDSIVPELINCSISPTSITNAAGNVVNFACTATDIRSDIQTIVAYLNSTTLNKTLTLSLTPSQTATGTYSIFSSSESLPSVESYYSITQVNVTDSSGNKLSNTTNLDFTVTVAPSGGTTVVEVSGGGGENIIPKKSCNLQFFPNTTILTQQNIVKKLEIINNELFTLSPTFIFNTSNLIEIKGDLDKVIPQTSTVEYSIIVANISLFRDDINITEDYYDSKLTLKSTECSDISATIRIQRSKKVELSISAFKNILNENIGEIKINKNNSLQIKFYQVMFGIFLITSLPYIRTKKFRYLNFTTKSTLILFTGLFFTLLFRIFIDLIKK